MAQETSLVNGKLVAKEVSGNGSNPGNKKRWYEIPGTQYKSLLDVARQDEIDIDGDTDRTKTVKANRAASTIINLIIEDFLLRRKAMGEAEEKAKGNEPLTGVKGAPTKTK